MEKDIILECKKLAQWFGDNKVLFDINIEIERGQIVAVVGPSGCGKSTLLRHLLGLHTPTSGSIKLLGKDITTSSPEEMLDLSTNMGVSFQGGALLSSMTIAENVMLPLREHANLDEQTMNIMAQMKLEVVNLGGFGDLKPSQLSGGMIKRAALARAIVMDPKLLFFDEPSAGLDPVVAAELDDLIIKLRDTMHMTIAVVTHELDSAFKIADRITILDHGKILLTGTVDQVRGSDNDRIQDLLNRRPREDDIDADEYLRRLTGTSAATV